jgi:hypothetical protein
VNTAWAYFLLRIVGNPFLPVFAAFIISSGLDRSKKHTKLRNLFVEYCESNAVRLGLPGFLLCALLINVPVEFATWGLLRVFHGPVGFEAFLAWRAWPKGHIAELAALPLLALPVAFKNDANLLGLFYLPLFLLAGVISLALTIWQIHHFGAP